MDLGQKALTSVRELLVPCNSSSTAISQDYIDLN